MEIEVLGIGNAFTAIHHQTSFLIRADRTYLIDGPQGLFRLLRTKGIPREEIDDVIVTHAHGDHVSGLETLLVWKKHAEGKRVRLYTSQQVFAELEKSFFPAFSRGFSPDLKSTVLKQFDEYVDFFELEEERVNSLEEGLTVEIRHNWHQIPTIGLKISHRGRTIAISGDNCYRPSLLQELRLTEVLSEARYDRLKGNWLWEADVIYHEVDSQADGPHTFLGDLLELPSDTRRRIRLVHVPDEFQTEEVPIASEGEKILIDETGNLSWR